MDKTRLQKFQDDILSKFRKYQSTNDIGLLHDIQGIVEKVGKKFVVESDEGHKMIFTPKKDPHVVEPGKEASRPTIGKFRRTESGIILPN